MQALLAITPVLSALLFALWCGTIGRGVGGWASLTGDLIVLAWAGIAILSARKGWNLLVGIKGPPSEVGGGGSILDPLRLGPRWGPVLLGTILGLAVLSLTLSDVPRAGRVGLVLAPAYFLMPWAFTRLWQHDAGRRWAALSCALALLVVSGLGLAGWLSGWTERAAEPLGHHNLLAAWCALLTPLALLTWRRGGIDRWVGCLAALSSLVAVVASRSLSGGTALLVGGLILLAGRGRQAVSTEASLIGIARWRPAIWLGLASFVLVLGLTQGARLESLVSGEDGSVAARRVYAEAGLQGVRAHPWVGLGPGATAWTLQRWLQPIPGVNPPGELVGDLHLFPLTLVYELGLPAAFLVLLLVLRFATCRWRERVAARDRGALMAGLATLAAAIVAGFGSGDWRLGALPMALTLGVGMALAGGGRGDREGSVNPAPNALEPRNRWIGGLCLALLLGALAVLMPIRWAQLQYDMSLDKAHAKVAGAPDSAPSADLSDLSDLRIGHLERAVAADPSFPLYRAALAARLAFALDSSGESAAQNAANQAFEAAQEADSVAPLWLLAGALAEQRPGRAGQPSDATLAWRRACSLDPLDPFAPFHLALAPSTSKFEARDLAARAILLQPLILAAVAWDERTELLRGALDSLEAEDDVEPGLRLAILEAAHLAAEREEGLDRAETPIVDLVFRPDSNPQGGLSIHLFRRVGGEREWPFVRLYEEAATALLHLPSAAELATTSPRFARRACSFDRPATAK